jgi:glucose-6-phosphate isomerase
MSYVKLNLDNALSFVSQEAVENMKTEIVKAAEVLQSQKGAGNDFLGWLNLPLNYDKEEFARILAAAERIKKQAEVLLVIGIGGSYLGAKSAIEMLRKYFGKTDVEIIFVGHQISGTYVNELIDYLKDKEFAINVISKSGTTTEPAIAFRIFKELIEARYGVEEAKNRIYATTDKARGALKGLATAMGYETFIVPDDVGGRYSVLTPVGLLPIACSGVDIVKMMEGAQLAHAECNVLDLEKNPSMQYALARNVLYRNGKAIEILVNYEQCLTYFAEWWKQLYGESEGKDGKGIYVASASFSTDLHSLGQMIQEGERNIFETVLQVTTPTLEQVIPFDEANLDGLNFLAGKTMDYVNKQAFLGTLLAHVDGGVPNIVVEFPEISAFAYGYLAYFFEFACGVSAYTLGINPFNQPGVEAYKKNMFALLGKPGYEALASELKAKLSK